MPTRRVISTDPRCKTAPELVPLSTACTRAKERQTAASSRAPLSWIRTTCLHLLLLSPKMDSCPICSPKCLLFVGQGKKSLIWFLTGWRRTRTRARWRPPARLRCTLLPQDRTQASGLSHNFCEKLHNFRSLGLQNLSQRGVDWHSARHLWLSEATRHMTRARWETDALGGASSSEGASQIIWFVCFSFLFYFSSLFDQNSHLNSHLWSTCKREAWVGGIPE